jgi:hypothetical protein
LERSGEASYVWYPAKLRQVAKETADALTRLIASKPTSMLTPAQLRQVAFYRGQGGALDVLAEEDDDDEGLDVLSVTGSGDFFSGAVSASEVLPLSADRSRSNVVASKTSTPMKTPGQDGQEDYTGNQLLEAYNLSSKRNIDLNSSSPSRQMQAARILFNSPASSPELTKMAAKPSLGHSSDDDASHNSSPLSSTSSSPEATLAKVEDPMDFFHRLGERVGNHLTDFGGWFTYADNIMSAGEARELGYCRQ